MVMSGRAMPGRQIHSLPRSGPTIKRPSPGRPTGKCKTYLRPRRRLTTALWTLLRPIPSRRSFSSTGLGGRGRLIYTIPFAIACEEKGKLSSAWRQLESRGLFFLAAARFTNGSRCPSPSVKIPVATYHVSPNSPNSFDGLMC